MSLSWQGRGQVLQRKGGRLTSPSQPCHISWTRPLPSSGSHPPLQSGSAMASLSGGAIAHRMCVSGVFTILLRRSLQQSRQPSGCCGSSTWKGSARCLRIVLARSFGLADFVSGQLWCQHDGTMCRLGLSVFESHPGLAQMLQRPAICPSQWSGC